MLDKLNFYDLLGYLLPGATVILVLYWISRYEFGVSLPDLQGDFGSSVFFIGMSYVVGQLVHGVGSAWENSSNSAYGGLRLSERLLSDECYCDIQYPFPSEVKERIFVSAAEVFAIARDKPREIFEHAYALIVQKGLDQHTEIFLALNGLARSMLVVSWIGLIVSAALTAKQITLEVLTNAGVALPPTWVPNLPQLLMGCVLIASFLVAEGLMRRAFHRFRMYFATSVYYNFLAWYGEQNFTASLKTP
jgi:hypothetical protein